MEDRSGAEARVATVPSVVGVVGGFGQGEGGETAREAEEVVEALWLKVAFDQGEGLEWGGVGEVVLEEEGVEFAGRVDARARDGERHERWMEEDDGVVT